MEALQALERDIEATEETLRRLNEAREILDPHDGELPSPLDEEEVEGVRAAAGRHFERVNGDGESPTQRARAHIEAMPEGEEFTVREVVTALGLEDGAIVHKLANDYTDAGVIARTRKKGERNATIYRRTDKQPAMTAS